jgi:hypothetical protein
MGSRMANPYRPKEGINMAPKKRAKTIVYRYDGNAKSDEEEFDQYGGFAVPKRQALIMRHGKLWKTVRVTRENVSSGQGPIVRVFLREQTL